MSAMSVKRPTLLLNAADVTRLLDIGECIAQVENGFRALGEGRVPKPEILGLHAHDGGLHVKTAVWGKYFVAKLNANFPQNPKRHGLPTIQGVVAVYDATNGEVLALLDSIEITAQRTAAATAVAAKYLARKDAKTLTLAGCGRQGMMHLHALRAVIPFTTVQAYDVDAVTLGKFVAQASSDLGIDVQRTADLAQAVAASDMVVTCTPATKFIVAAKDVR